MGALETGLETTGDNSFSASELEAFGTGLAVRLGASWPAELPQQCNRDSFNINQAIRCLSAVFGTNNNSFNADEIKEALQNSLEATGDEALTFNEVEAFGTGVSVRLGVSWPTGTLPSQCDRDSFNVNQATRCLRAVLGGSNGEQASYDADEIRSALETT